jgi:hypothetical protein
VADAYSTGGALLDLFGQEVTVQEKKTRRSRRREATKFWMESEAKGRLQPEALLSYYLQAAFEAGDKETAIRIAMALLPYRLPRLAAVMVQPAGDKAPRYSIAWQEDDDGDAAAAGGAAGVALLAAAIPEGDTSGA